MTQQERLTKIEAGIKFFKNFPEKWEAEKTKRFFYRWLEVLEEYLKTQETSKPGNQEFSQADTDPADPVEEFLKGVEQMGYLVE